MRPCSQCLYYHYSEDRSHSYAITINTSPSYWQMFHLNKHNQDLGRFTLAAAKTHEYSLISSRPRCYSSCCGKRTFWPGWGVLGKQGQPEAHGACKLFTAPRTGGSRSGSFQFPPNVSKYLFISQHSAVPPERAGTKG